MGGAGQLLACLNLPPGPARYRWRDRQQDRQAGIGSPCHRTGGFGRCVPAEYQRSRRGNHRPETSDPRCRVPGPLPGHERERDRDHGERSIGEVKTGPEKTVTVKPAKEFRGKSDNRSNDAIPGRLVVRLSAIDLLCPVDLLEEDHPGHLVGEGQRREGEFEGTPGKDFLR